MPAPVRRRSSTRLSKTVLPSLRDDPVALTPSTRTQEGEEREASRQDIWPEAVGGKALSGPVTLVGEQSWCPEGKLPCRQHRPADIFKRQPVARGFAIRANRDDF